MNIKERKEEKDLEQVKITEEVKKNDKSNNSDDIIVDYENSDTSINQNIKENNENKINDNLNSKEENQNIELEEVTEDDIELGVDEEQPEIFNPSDQIISLIKELDKGDGAMIEDVIEKSNIEGSEKIIKNMIET